MPCRGCLLAIERDLKTSPEFADLLILHCGKRLCEHLVYESFVIDCVQKSGHAYCLIFAVAVNLDDKVAIYRGRCVIKHNIKCFSLFFLLSQRYSVFFNLATFLTFFLKIFVKKNRGASLQLDFRIKTKNSYT